MESIEGHGIVGDLHTIALVGMDGTIDFMCFPRFDSPTIFGALLDPDAGGHFKLAPLIPGARRKQVYLPDSTVLLSRFLDEEGVAEISDFMPIQDLGHNHDLLRRAKSVRGTIPFRMECAPRFNYGRSRHRIETHPNEVLFISEGPDKTVLRLRTKTPVRIENGVAAANFKLRPGETAEFVLEDGSPGSPSPASAPHYVSQAFAQTRDYWERWLHHSLYRGRWREMVNRSALTLKLLTSAPFGSIVAAPTFGLPEELGGVRNWDYRYTWIRDASFTIYALMRLGYISEATAFIRWIEMRCREWNPEEPFQVMYGIDGRHAMPEEQLEHWSGYQNSRPVRIGNGALNQRQLDIYGELLDSVYLYNQLEPISYDFWKIIVKLIDWVCKHWQQPDYGIWEVRGGPYEFLYSRMMCWVSIDRALHIARNRSFPAPWDHWTRIRDEIYQDIYEHFWNEELGTFVQFKGAQSVDAATLLMPLVKFISPADPRWRSTLNVINQRLVEDSMVYRYNVLKGAQDGLPGKEGTFTACSFWNVECLARVGNLKQARFYFEKPWAIPITSDSLLRK